MPVAMGWARRVMALTEGRAWYWSEKARWQGLRHLEKGVGRYKTASRLERLDREHRRREKTGTAGSSHNLLALFQKRGLTNRTA